MARPMDLNLLLKELIQIGIALTSERDLSVLLENILREARRFTRADAGTLFLREGDCLRFAVVKNDSLVHRIGETEMKSRLQAEPLPLSETSLAGYVARPGGSSSPCDPRRSRRRSGCGRRSRGCTSSPAPESTAPAP